MTTSTARLVSNKPGKTFVTNELTSAYDTANQMTEIVRFADLVGNQHVATSTYDYDNLGRLVDLTHANSTEVIAKYEYTFDIASRITEWVLPDGVSTFNYDATDQLTTADHTFQDDENFDYDLNGNRIGNGLRNGGQQSPHR